jgi:hypothetical protein
LRPDPEAAIEAMSAVLARGGHLFRPDGVPAFAGGPACTLLRLSGRGNLAVVGGNGLIEASVTSPNGRARPPLTCADHDGSVLFRLLAYEPAARAVVAVDAGGAPLATFLIDGADVDVRDETSAPAARLRRARGRFELVETGGGVVAAVGSGDVEVDGWIDDQWWLQPEDGARLPIRTLAAVALVLAAKVLLGRPAPIRPPDRGEEPDDVEGWPFG